MVMGSAGHLAVVGVPTQPHGELPIEILESKLYKPAIRPGVVPRPSLLARLRAARSVPTVAVVAPAGYGKTTLLALWAQDDDRLFAWLSVDPHDNDPIVLLTHLAVALDRISPLPTEVFDALGSAGVSVPATVVPRLGSALSHLPHPVVIVLDDVHHLRDGASLDALVTLVGHVPGTTQIALAGRGMPVPLARQRAQGRAVEIGVESLAFSEEGARSLLRAAGTDLPDGEVAQLARRTEGWAAGLYLAALSRTGIRLTTGVGAQGGDDRLLTDFLQSELLSRLSPRDLSFLTQTSVLDRLSGPLCDAVLEESGLSAELEHLQKNNLFLVPLDGQGQWYRYHSLFRDLLRQRLDRAGREHSRQLLLRAADWCEADGQLEAALHYAQEAEDVDRVARIAVALARPMYGAGRSATLMAWLEWADERGAVERHPAVAAVAAYVCALTGRPAAADRWADLAERFSGPIASHEQAKDFAMWRTSARGLMCRDGVERMRSDLDDAARHVPGAGSADDTEYPTRLFLSGVASLLLDDRDTAETRFTDATELTDEAARAPLSSIAMAYRAVLALGRGDWSGADTLVERALSVARRGHTASHITSMLVFALAARVALHRRDLTLARAQLGEAQRLRPLLSHAIPWYAVGSLVEMADVSIGLGEPSGAHQFIRDAEAVLRRRPDLGTLGKRTDELRGRLGALQAAGSDSSTLTSAELRILPLLLTHLTLAGIADRLFLSRHTVKSQVWSMYRKLGVHTRSDAVIRARELGLLEA
jgi:LuxR family maltose regulon positive regulatory protein